MTTTTYMVLVLPTVSETVGPDWASDIVAALQRVDLHDHSAGNGAKVTPAGLNINAALNFAGQAAQQVKFLGLNSQANGDASDAGSFVRIGTNIWWKNAAGAMVQLTSGTALATPGTGEISASVISSYPYSVLTGDAQKVLVIDSSAARTVNLPAALNSMFVMIKDGGGLAATNNISVVPDGADLIDGSNSAYLIDANYGAIGLVSDGVSKWHVV